MSNLSKTLLSKASKKDPKNLSHYSKENIASIIMKLILGAESAEEMTREGKL